MTYRALHTPQAQHANAQATIEDVVYNFQHLGDKKRMRSMYDQPPVQTRRAKTSPQPHDHNTRCAHQLCVANTRLQRDADQHMCESPAYSHGGGVECNIELWGFHTMRYQKQRTAFLKGRLVTHSPRTAPMSHEKPPLSPQIGLGTRAGDACKTSARLWIFAAGAVLSVHPYVLHTAAHLFDVYASVRTVYTHDVLQYAAVALMLSSKECGSAGLEQGTVAVSDLLVHCHTDACCTPTLRHTASAISNATLPHVGMYGALSAPILLKKELDVFCALDYHVNNRVTLLHFVGILLDVMDATTEIREAANDAAGKHCVENSTFSTDVEADALCCVHKAIALADLHDTRYSKLLAEHMLAVKHSPSTQIGVDIADTPDAVAAA